MRWNIESDDIRYTKANSETKITYLESLTVEIDMGNSWLNSFEWSELRKALPTMTEEQAKVELFRITNEISDRVAENKMRYD